MHISMDFLKLDLTQHLFNQIKQEISDHIDNEDGGATKGDETNGTQLLKYGVMMVILKQIVFLTMAHYCPLAPSHDIGLQDMDKISESFNNGLIKLIDEFKIKSSN